MLEVLPCQDFENKRDIFNSHIGPDQTWVVSDLQSKWHLQKELLTRQGVLEQSAVQRATELWRQLALQVRPDLRILSPELAQTLFWTWIEPLNLPWAKSPQAVPVVLNQMQMWMSLFCDPRHGEIMQEWFAANPESYVRWGHWFELCGEIWRRCQSEGLVMVNWLPAVLLQHDLSRLVLPQALTFDLGVQISQVEGQLIRELARYREVRVVFPQAGWVSLMKNTLRPYDDLLPEPYRGDVSWTPSVNKQIKFNRFSTQLAEVKDSVAQVRAWCESGVLPSSIAVVAPDIEEYWPALRLYFAQEGIPVGKPVTTRLGGFLEMAQWLASLRTALAKVTASDLEVFLFSKNESPRLSHDEFRVLFTHVYDNYDLRRAQHLFESPTQPLPASPLPLADFLAWSLGFWRSSSERLASFLQVLGQEVPPRLELRPKEWLGYFEGLLARREVSQTAAAEQGVACVSLSSADWLPVTHGIFLNLSEGALRRLDHSPVSHAEAQKIFTDTGYAIGTSDHQELEFELLWFLQRPWEELSLGFAGSDFSGRVLTPSKIWMWTAFANDGLKHLPQAPERTRWDEVQRQGLESLGQLRAWDELRVDATRTALARETSVAISSWRPSVEERISASSLEKFWRCPFIFAAERKLKLSDEPALDLDLDRRTRGSLLHALAEALSAEPLRFDLSDDEIASLVEDVRSREQIQLGDERLWPAQRAQHVRLARYFLEFERQWRARFPSTKTVGRELAFQTHWDVDKAGPTQETTGITLSGRIDRVDSDGSGRYAVIDYKASAGGLRNWKSWIENHEIQLALYTLLLEEGLTELASGPVVAANYYVIKESDRRKGFHLRDETSELYSSQDRHFNFIAELEKDELLKTLRSQITEALREILAGHLNPQPEDESQCVGCSWRTLCRAPHLD